MLARLAALSIACILLSAGAALAGEPYPTRPLRWIVPYPPGGTTDIVARIIGQSLSERLGQPVIIENRAGGGTNIGTQAAVNSAPDGYTLLFAAATNAINVTLYEQLPFNFIRDIAPVAGIGTLPLVLDGIPSFPARTVGELIDYAKANPGKVAVGSFGAATISHLAIELLQVKTGAKFLHVPYRGGAPLINGLLAGDVQAGVDALPASLPHIQSGSLRALGLSARSGLLPGVAAISDTIPGYDVSTWMGIGVPAATPPAIIEQLNREITAGLSDPAVQARLAQIGMTPMPLTPAAFGAMIAAETEKWAKVIKAAGIKAD
jgi:tripartite-type tricarboxylate transporter receptor subunit TctC